MTKMFPAFVLSAVTLILAACSGSSGTGPEAAKPRMDSTLVGYWSFEEGGDTAKDLSGNGNHLGLSNASRAEGVSGRALSLSGSSTSFGEATRVAGLALDSFTLSCWVKPNGLSTRHQAILSRENQTGNLSNYRLLLDGPDIQGIYKQGHPSLDARNREPFSAENVVVARTRIDDGEWYFLVATRRGREVTVWVDGELSVRDTVGSGLPRDTTTSLRIGGSAYEGGSYAFAGLIDEVRIHSRPLDSAEIISLYQD